MADISGITPQIMGTTATSRSSSEEATKNALGLSMDDFLQILAASMSNPSMTGEGGSDSTGTDYISQMAQFATVQELNELSSTMNNSLLLGFQQQAFNLMGKEVTVVDQDGKDQQGKVDKVSFIGGDVKLIINGKEYEMSSVKDVSEAAK